MKVEHPVQHAAAPTESTDLSEPLKAMLRHLEEMRVLQVLLDRERARELEEQHKLDAEAQRLMEMDPQGHIEMMRPLQEQAALVRELPPALLEYEAAMCQEIKRAERAQALRPRALRDVLMTGHVLMERWPQYVLLLFGAWLMVSPATLGYKSAALAWSDVLSGALVILLAALTVAGRRWAPWANSFVGLWLMFAPLAFWAPDAGSYANDTLVGALVIGFAVLVAMRTEMPGPDVPPGWTYNPSTWEQRAPIIALALISFFMARYMAAFQLEHISSVWDPIFGRGTELVLTSEVSRAFPISDAGLGAYTYMIEVLSGLMGDNRRWRTMPWMVALFGIAVVPLGITSVVLIMLQPLAVGAWCTLCLISALFMLVMIAFSLDEILASIQFLIIGRRAGLSAWRLFWAGGELPPRTEDFGLSRVRTNAWAEMFPGTTAPWTLLASAFIGAWLLAAPAVFDMPRTAGDVERVLGTVVCTVAFIALAEIGRAARFTNILLGVAIAVLPWVFEGTSLPATLNSVVAGFLLIVLSIPRGSVRHRYGGWDPFIV